MSRVEQIVSVTRIWFDIETGFYITYFGYIVPIGNFLSTCIEMGDVMLENGRFSTVHRQEQEEIGDTKG